MVGGAANNVVASGATGATIGGGGGVASDSPVPNRVGHDFATVGGGFSNTANGYATTVGGGRSNTAGFWELATVGGGSGNTASGAYSTVGGGFSNTADGTYATVGGGIFNTASGARATIPGGSHNIASGSYSFAAGYVALARHSGTFVWADSTGNSFVSTGENQFLIRANGGVGIGTNQPGADLHIAANSNAAKPQLLLQEKSSIDYARFRLHNDSSSRYWDIAGGGTDNLRLNFYTNQGRGDVMSLRATGTPLVMYNGATLTPGGEWTNSSTIRRKTDFVDIDPKTVLEGLAALPVRQWRYKVESEHVIHIGPTAEDFHQMFGLGESTETIGTLDAAGVSLAAIQGLYELVQELQAEVKELRAVMEQLRDELR